MVGTRFAELHDHRVALCLFFIIFITRRKLARRARSRLVVCRAQLCVHRQLSLSDRVRDWCVTLLNPGIAPSPDDADLKIAEGYEPHVLNWFLLLGAFANGCAALTGIEAISNGVQAFKQPESKNAATTLGWMAGYC